MHESIVAALSEDVLEGGRVVVDVDGLEIGIFRVDGRLYAWENQCAHLGGPVCQGTLMNRVVERLDDARRSLGDDFGDELHIVCPWHGYEYDVRTGRHPADPSARLRSIEVEEREGEIHVRV
ncbi:MAG: Rieske (2Fe-2S) protein [Solirubrobacteraceae bacterium]